MTSDSNPNQKSVALLIETSNAYARGLLGGIASYMHEHELWSIYLPEQERGATPPAWLKNWKGDGIIARIENEMIAEAISDLEVPIIDVSAARHVPNIPWVETNDRVIAQLAYEHLRERGFEHFAFCGDPNFAWSQWREKAFVKCVTDGGFQCSVFPEPGTRNRKDTDTSSRDHLASWIGSLPQPVGMLACYDIKAQNILDVCREMNVKVPGDLALLGVDNDELLCDLCTPPLSSIIPAAHQTGRKAAELLDTLMQGGQVDVNAYLIDPIGVSTRQSTDVLAISDPDIAAAIRLIRDHCCDGINVKDLLEKVPMSRRAFESRFQSIVGRSPHQEIIRRRIDRVRQLLVETDLTLAQVAIRTGFQNQEYMSVAFRRSMDVPPGTYRRNSRQTNTRSDH